MNKLPTSIATPDPVVPAVKTDHVTPAVAHQARVPITTYRLQMHQGFGFRDAIAMLTYLNRLGVTDCYTSPLFKARPGSTHGYDITNHHILNPELGAEADYETFSATLRDFGMGHVLDIVPNHMGNDPQSNPWWRDILENGPASPFARFFDIDWSPVKPELKNKVLLPILGDQYGVVLESGELRISFENGALILRYGDNNLPINPRQTPNVLKINLEALQKEMGSHPDLREFLSILTELSNLPTIVEREPARIEERQREKEVARERLDRLYKASEPIRRHLVDCLSSINGQPGNRGSFDALHKLLEAQAYRLSYWKTASQEINYRRFFDINQLAGLRMERPEVFEATHERLLKLLKERKVTGLRVDHPDGLYDPAAYFQSLQKDGGPVYVVVEKILSAGEALRKAWPIDGTSGYDFLNLINHLWVDASHAEKFKELYERFIGRQADCQEEMYRCKKLIMSTSLASELNVLAHHLNQISETNRMWRDFTLDSLRDALREVVACMPIYRTYINDSAPSPSDVLTITKSIARAKDLNPALESSIFDFIRTMLVPVRTAELPEEEYQRRLAFAMKFQQYTAPVQAKGVEDTAFYRYNVLLSVNEVGGDLERFGISVSDFHQANLERQHEWPNSLIATATHDTKRGEDARVRLDALSEFPEDWERALVQWRTMNRPHKTEVDNRVSPDANDEYLIYQALLGAWPLQPLEQELETFTARIHEFLIKAIREAKRFTSWIRPNEAYEKATLEFVDHLLADKASNGFLSSFQLFAELISAHGMINSLSQVALKMAAPGVPDFFQGTELWDWSLVDPDNRRPVDYEIRSRTLSELEPLLAPPSDPKSNDRKDALRKLLEGWKDGKIKMLLTTAGLRHRKAHADLFLKGSYIPLKVVGEMADQVVAFVREFEQTKLIVIVPRLVARKTLKPSLWASTRVQLPETWKAASGLNLFTGETSTLPAGGEGGSLLLKDVFATLPVAWIDVKA